MPTRQNEWNKQNMMVCRTAITKSGAIGQALEKALQEARQSPSEYTRAAIIEKLQNDGYLNNRDAVYSGPHGSLRLPKDE